MKWLSGAELGQTQGDIEKSIETWLIAQIEEYAEKFVEPETYLKNANNKWRAASAMQKAIRQGNADLAVRMVYALWGLDPKYVWRRLCTVAIEDIGIGDVRLTAAMMWVSGKEKWRISHGGDALVLTLIVKLLAEAPKDRHACDLLVWADLAPELAERRHDFSEMAVNGEFYELASFLLDESNLLAERMIAAWCLTGTKAMPGARFAEFSGMGLKALSELVTNEIPNLPEVIPMTMRWAANKQYEGMPMAYPLVYQLARKSLEGKEIVTSGDELIGLPMIGNYPSSAFDMHNQEGKRAISYFVKCCHPIHDFLTKFMDVDDPANKPKITEAIGTLIFRVEGHQVFPRLQYDGMTDLLELAEFAHLQGNFIPGKYAEWGMALVKANMPVLHHARCRILGLESVAPEVAEIPGPFDGAVPMPKWGPGSTKKIFGYAPSISIKANTGDLQKALQNLKNEIKNKHVIVGMDYAELESHVLHHYGQNPGPEPLGLISTPGVHDSIFKQYVDNLNSAKTKKYMQAYGASALQIVKKTPELKTPNNTVLAALQEAIAEQISEPVGLGLLEGWKMVEWKHVDAIKPIEVYLENVMNGAKLTLELPYSMLWMVNLSGFKSLLWNAMAVIYDGEGLCVPKTEHASF